MAPLTSGKGPSAVFLPKDLPVLTKSKTTHKVPTFSTLKTPWYHFPKI